MGNGRSGLSKSSGGDADGGASGNGGESALGYEGGRGGEGGNSEGKSNPGEIISHYAPSGITRKVSYGYECHLTQSQLKSGSIKSIRRIFGQPQTSSELVTHKCHQPRESRREMDGAQCGNRVRNVAI